MHSPGDRENHPSRLRDPCTGAMLDCGEVVLCQLPGPRIDPRMSLCIVCTESGYHESLRFSKSDCTAMFACRARSTAPNECELVCGTQVIGIGVREDSITKSEQLRRRILDPFTLEPLSRLSRDMGIAPRRMG